MKLEDASVEAVQELVTYLKQAADFSVEQAPAIAQEFLAWSLLAHQVGLAVCAVVVAAMCVVFVAAWKWTDGSDGWVIASVIMGIAGFCALILAGDNIYQLIYLAHAPKVYLLEHLAKLL